MKTFEKVLEIFREYLDCDLEEEVLPCREGYLRVTWNGDSRYCVDGLLSRTPDELFEVLLSDYRSYEELRLTKGCREVTEVVISPVTGRFSCPIFSSTVIFFISASMNRSMSCGDFCACILVLRSSDDAAWMRFFFPYQVTQFHQCCRGITEYI